MADVIQTRDSPSGGKSLSLDTFVFEVLCTWCCLMEKDVSQVGVGINVYVTQHNGKHLSTLTL